MPACQALCMQVDAIVVNIAHIAKKDQFARVALVCSYSAARQVLIGLDYPSGKRTSRKTGREITVCWSEAGVSHDMRRLS